MKRVMAILLIMITTAAILFLYLRKEIEELSYRVPQQIRIYKDEPQIEHGCDTEESERRFYLSEKDEIKKLMNKINGLKYNDADYEEPVKCLNYMLYLIDEEGIISIIVIDDTHFQLEDDTGDYGIKELTDETWEFLEEYTFNENAER
ncbi:hypothetical protein [Haloplasma contractile]|uniref:Uncharacterized protein n=1 Tax=Haloplasma contractile SSD-17B TaxID=1033810 RepID=F7Q0S8_9MOLU|nr:hypothetical protein [Haloplasma contractile]ERJ11301.1 hypothetical protein HLPCO_002603 [Haloplasma contractile SSD-17B]